MKERTAVLLTVTLLLAAASWTPGFGADRSSPAYLERLRLPAATDIFKWPLAVHADRHSGEIFVCDQLNDRLVIFDGAGSYRYQIRGGISFRTPLDVALFPEGYILVLGFVEGRRQLVLLDFDGKPIRDLSLSGLPPEAVEPELVSIALSEPGDRLYLLDQANFALWLALPDGRITGMVDLVAELPDEEALEQFLGHVDVYGRTVLVSLPMDGRVRLFDLEGEPRGEVGIKGTSPCQTAFPVAAALDRAGDLLILDQQRMLVMRWRPEGNECLEEIGGVGSRPGQFYKPADLTLDSAGRLYVSQGFDGRVQVFEGAVPAAGSTPAPAGE